MSCHSGVHVSQQPAAAVGLPNLEPAWAAGRGSNGHCPDCGGFLRKADRGCTRCERSGRMSGVRIADLETTTDAAGLAIATGRSLHPAEQMAILRNPHVSQAAATRLAQTARDPVVRTQALARVKSLAYERVTSALRDRGVPEGQAAMVYSMPWQYLDRCPLCRAWVSPKRGVCKNPRCKERGKQVAPVRPWPPRRVAWTTKAGAVGTMAPDTGPSPGDGDAGVVTEPPPGPAGDSAAEAPTGKPGQEAHRTALDLLVTIARQYNSPDEFDRRFRVEQIRKPLPRSLRPSVSGRFFSSGFAALYEVGDSVVLLRRTGKTGERERQINQVDEDGKVVGTRTEDYTAHEFEVSILPADRLSLGSVHTRRVVGMVEAEDQNAAMGIFLYRGLAESSGDLETFWRDHVEAGSRTNGTGV